MQARSIRVSGEVWEAIAARGKFGETEDDVLRRLLKLDPGSESQRVISSSRPGRGSRRFSTKVMRARIQDNRLTVSFEDGNQKSWSLPNKQDKEGIREARDAAAGFAIQQGATVGQRNAVYKALTDAGYHLNR